ncbi:hypothetical protein PRUB_b0056 [Pseudoalteromonas rubra]|uniref:Uncharacterized protein n=1 Tax=Pseudoalteromonas rubra TaxID=43658 RepID=A0A8T0BYE0_9GAMM|nr:hypothetical protein PRUB_b0056 [Pseudoalteromonas rubra]
MKQICPEQRPTSKQIWVSDFFIGYQRVSTLTQAMEQP